ncbi:uncharacterized protein CANTADRAFT_25263 [Suhomyces tanzawaensis NRRL Y-17324]|uniref:Clustered mitochondria protein homolog n=1 Tax=Suhomyces tanzawaensis NRRL Y-17324 TaxID=984487 RepID=A0A1E4SN67_9ASCO|nr:uncharacterized protein CANTADRAFT_25263 [Suhomyces tanzawaensis NRRL Y-17324]ODV80928.1 hypothetical protein CANTADRAFT_25263 [Suhomyces tanzawaensis NRRL Y-17324]
MSAPETNDAVQAESREITLKIQLPKCLSESQEVLEVPSTTSETLADLKQVLLLLPATKNLTNYSVLLRGVNITEQFDEISPYSEILETLGLEGEVTELHLVIKEVAYNLAGVFEQITRFREVIGLHYIDKISQDFGVSSGVTKFNDLGLTDLKVPEPKEEQEPKEEEEQKENSAESEEKAEESKISEEDLQKIVETTKTITEHDSSISKFAEFNSLRDQLKIPVKSLTVSQWSPVPAFRKTKGDLLYLTLQTLESETFNITCSYSGFFVNQSSTANFNADMKVNEKGKFSKSYLLYNLVDSLSPSFSKTIKENEITLSTSTEHPETYLLPNNSFLASPWLVNADKVKIHPDLSRFQLPVLNNGVDGSEIIKEWNEDIQAIRELPNSNIQERILKEKLIHKTLADFTKFASETAINIIKGNLTPMNPNEEPDKQIYLKNGIFYTSGATTVDLFDTTGGAEASRYASSKDLASIKVLNRVDASGIYSLVTCIVDFMGKRVVCQAPVPGIFNQTSETEVDEKVVYGLSSDNSSILRDESFTEPLKQVAETFHLKPHTVELSEEIKSDGELVVSKDTKGVRGSDGRKYIMDLYRTSPRDIEFIEAHYDSAKVDSYPHGEALIRHEAVAEYWKREISTYIKEENAKLEKEGKSDEEKAQIVLPTDKAVFNPDAFSGINEKKEDQDEVRVLSKFIKDTLIEEFLTEFPSQVAPFDGKHLSESLHKQGINLRYLGYLAEQALIKRDQVVKEEEKTIQQNIELAEQRQKEADEAAKVEQESKDKEESKDDSNEESKDESKESSTEPEQTKGTFQPIIANYTTLHRLATQEMIARAVKHLLRQLSVGVPEFLFPSFVAHFHNCLLGSNITTTPEVVIDETVKSFIDENALEWVKLTSEGVFFLIEKEVYSRFRYTLPKEWNQKLIHPVQLMREIAIKFGIQWKSQDYVFTKEEFDQVKDSLAVETQVIETAKSKKNKKKSASASVATTKVTPRSSTFVADDIVNFLPLVKDSGYKSSLIDEIFQSARAHIYQGDKETGASLLNELINIQEQLYGIVHPETAKLFSMISQVYADIGLEYQAAVLARKAIILAERTTGFDSYDTISAYMNSGFYESSNLELVNSLKLYKQAINVWSTVYGRDHPTLVTTLTNLAESLTRVKLYPSAAKLFEEALGLSIKTNGPVSQLTGSIYYSLALLLLNSGKFKESLNFFSIAQDIFTKVLGPDDFLSRQSSKYSGSIAKYLEFLEAQEKQKKQLAKQAKKAPVQAPKAPESKKKTKNGKKSAIPDPEIASKSVEDILKFIEGDQPKKAKKSKK